MNLYLVRNITALIIGFSLISAHATDEQSNNSVNIDKTGITISSGDEPSNNSVNIDQNSITISSGNENSNNSVNIDQKGIKISSGDENSNNSVNIDQKGITISSGNVNAANGEIKANKIDASQMITTSYIRTGTIAATSVLRLPSATRNPSYNTCSPAGFLAILEKKLVVCLINIHGQSNWHIVNTTPLP